MQNNPIFRSGSQLTHRLPPPPKTQDQIMMSDLPGKANEIMNLVAKKITYCGSQLDPHYANNKNRYFKSNPCCNMLFRAFGYEGYYARKVNRNYIDNPDELYEANRFLSAFVFHWLSIKTKTSITKPKRKIEKGHANCLREVIKLFINVNEGTCIEQCVMLMLALLDDNRNDIKQGDIELVFLQNASSTPFDRNPRENHFLLRVKAGVGDYCHLDPLTKTVYDATESANLGLNDYDREFKLKGLEDRYSVSKCLVPGDDVIDMLKKTSNNVNNVYNLLAK